MRSSNPPHTVPHCVEWTRRGRLDVSHHQSNIGRAQHNDQPPSRSSTGNRGQYNTSDDGFSFSRRLSLLLLRTYEVSCRSRSTWSFCEYRFSIPSSPIYLVLDHVFRRSIDWHSLSFVIEQLNDPIDLVVYPPSCQPCTMRRN